MGMEHDLVEKQMMQKALLILHRAVDLMAAELAQALPNKGNAGNSAMWIAYAEATLATDARNAASAERISENER